MEGVVDLHYLDDIFKVSFIRSNTSNKHLTEINTSDQVRTEFSTNRQEFESCNRSNYWNRGKIQGPSQVINKSNKSNCSTVVGETLSNRAKLVGYSKLLLYTLPL